MRAGAALALAALSLVGCSGGTAGGAGEPAQSTSQSPTGAPLDLGDDFLLLDFDGPDPLLAHTGDSTSPVQALGGAPLRTVPSGDGSRGLEFPAFATHDEARLVLLAAPSTTSASSPSASASAAPRLSFGADVRLATSGADRQDDDQGGGADGDNGDNVVQRGLYSDDEQLKLQVDHRVPSCTVRTPRMRAFAKASAPLGEGWYRLACRYDGSVLRVVVAGLGAGAAAESSVVVGAPAGEVRFDAGVGLSIGGKVTAAGELVRTQPDQFNGDLDNVYTSPGL